jgi:mRNA interferase MazF
MNQYDIYLVSLDPAAGHEIRKTRPCVILSPDEMNRHISTVIVAPMTTQSHPYPSRVPVEFKRRRGWIVLDQIRALDRQLLAARLGRLKPGLIKNVKAVIKEMLVD